MPTPSITTGSGAPTGIIRRGLESISVSAGEVEIELYHMAYII